MYDRYMWMYHGYMGVYVYFLWYTVVYVDVLLLYRVYVDV